MIKNKINPEFSDKVDLSSEVDAFMDLVAYAMKVLVGGIMERLDSPFRTMIQTNWAGDAQVGEESAYVHQFHSVLLDVIPKIRESLASSYFNTFCTKLATEILQRLAVSIFCYSSHILIRFLVLDIMMRFSVKRGFQKPQLSSCCWILTIRRHC